MARPLLAYVAHDRRRRASPGHLRDTVRTDSDALSNLWHSVADGQRAAERAMAEARKKGEPKPKPAALPYRWLVIVECASEQAQAEALRLCQDAGLRCKAVTS